MVIEPARVADDAKCTNGTGASFDPRAVTGTTPPSTAGARLRAAEVTRGPERCSARGFTLVEMLVAIAIFALAAALAYGGLDAVVRARAGLDAQNERLGKLQFAVGLIERDLRSAVARGVRDGYGSALPPLAGARDRIELSHLQVASVLTPQRAQIERVGYRLREGTLQRLRWRVLDRVPGSQAIEDDLLDAVEGLRIDYLAADGRELSQWPAPNAAADLLPRAVVVTLQLADQGEVRRVLELPVEGRVP